jgi:hypothetical protein
MKPRRWLAGITALAGTFAAPADSGENPRVTTTVFVNRHFEVCDHDQPVKYVFNGDTRVARVTGSFSANARLQRLQAGWNLVSLAVTASDRPGQLEQFADGPLIVALDRWQPATADYLPVPVGQTVAAGSAKVGGKLMDIAASTLRMPTPDQVDRSLPGNKNYTWEHYTSPEGTGTHEFGHSDGLDHVHGEPNLMQRGNERKFDNTVVTLDQIKTMHKAFKAGKLNQREEMLDEFTRKR